MAHVDTSPSKKKAEVVVSKNTVAAPTQMLEKQYGPLLKKLEDRMRAKGEDPASIQAQLLLSQSNSEDPNTNRATDNDDAAAPNSGSQTLPFNSSSSVTDGRGTSQLGNTHTTNPSSSSSNTNNGIDELIDTHYSAITDTVDLGEVVSDLPEVSPQSVVVIANARHNETIAAHKEKWDSVKKKMNRQSAEAARQAAREIDLDNLGGDSDVDIRSDEATSNYLKIKKLAEGMGTYESSSEEEYEEETEDGPVIRRRKKGRIDGYGSSSRLSGLVFGDERSQELQRLLNEANQTIRRMKEDHKNRVAELKLENQLAMKAFEAKYNDEVSALRREIDTNLVRERKMREDSERKLEDSGRRIDEALARVEVEVVSKRTMELKLQTRVAEVEADLESSESQLKSMTKTFAEAKETWDNEKSSLTKEKESLQVQFATVGSDLETKSAALEEALAKIAQLEESEKALKEELDETRTKLEQSETTREKAEDHISDLTSGRETFEKSVWARFEDQVTMLQEQSKQLSEEKHISNNKNRVLEDQLQKMQNQMKELDVQRRQVKSIFSELQKAQTTVKELQTGATEMKSRKTELICQNAILRAQLSHLTRTTTLQQRISDLEEQNQWLNSKVLSLQKRHLKKRGSVHLGENGEEELPPGEQQRTTRSYQSAFLSDEEKTAALGGSQAVVYEQDIGVQANLSDINEESPLRKLRRRQSSEDFISTGVQAVDDDLDGRGAAAAASRRHLSPSLQRYLNSSPQRRAMKSIEEQIETKLEERLTDLSAGGSGGLAELERPTRKPPVPRPSSALSTVSSSVVDPKVRPLSATFSRPLSAASKRSAMTSGTNNSGSHLTREMVTNPQVVEASPLAVTGTNKGSLMESSIGNAFNEFHHVQLREEVQQRRGELQEKLLKQQQGEEPIVDSKYTGGHHNTDLEDATQLSEQPQRGHSEGAVSSATSGGGNRPKSFRRQVGAATGSGGVAGGVYNTYSQHLLTNDDNYGAEGRREESPQVGHHNSGWEPTQYTIGTTPLASTVSQGVPSRRSSGHGGVPGQHGRSNFSSSSTRPSSALLKSSGKQQQQQQSVNAPPTFPGFQPALAPAAGSWRPRLKK